MPRITQAQAKAVSFWSFLAMASAPVLLLVQWVGDMFVLLSCSTHMAVTPPIPCFHVITPCKNMHEKPAPMDPLLTEFYIRHTENKSGRVYPEDKVTNRFTIFASIHDYVIISKIRYAYICKETNLLLSNDWNAKKTKVTCFWCDKTVRKMITIISATAHWKF